MKVRWVEEEKAGDRNKAFETVVEHLWKLLIDFEKFVGIVGKKSSNKYIKKRTNEKESTTLRKTVSSITKGMKCQYITWFSNKQYLYSHNDANIDYWLTQYQIYN